MKIAIVLTTIHVPHALQSYIDNCRHFGHKNVIFIVVGDTNTPKACLRYLSTLKKSGYAFIYLGPKEQKEFLNKDKELYYFLPFKSIQRRNIGYLYAARYGAEIIISIDDDNFCLPKIDYISAHKKVGSVQKTTTLSSPSGWINLCQYLKTSPQREFYHRGYPLNKRWIKSPVKTSSTTKRIVVNVGFWLGDPDVDTITRLEEPFQVTAYKPPFDALSLAADTWHPFNSQNTAFHRDLLPCLFLITLGPVNKTMNIQNFRYDDIWMSYLMKKAIDRMKDQICFGAPLVTQQRNPHDFLLDLERESLAYFMTPKLIEMLDSIRLKESNYGEIYAELASQLEASPLKEKILNPLEKQCLKQMIKGMRLWLKAAAKI